MTVQLYKLSRKAGEYVKHPLATGTLIKEPETGKSVIVGNGLYGAHATLEVLDVMKIDNGWMFQTVSADIYEIQIMEEK